MIDCDNLKKCFVEFSDKHKTLKDKGKSIYKIENPTANTYTVIDFENCVYRGLENETKCDFGLLNKKELYFIELKGSDVKHGIKQILSTINDIKHCFVNYSLNGRLIVTKSPKPHLVKQNKEYKDLVKLLTSPLEIKQNIFTEKI